MDSPISLVIGVIIGLFSAGSFAVKAILWVLENPDKANLWIEGISSKFRWIGAKAERQAVGAGIQGHVASMAKRMNAVAGEIIPYALKVEWVQKSTLESFLKDDQVVIRMDYHENQGRNLALAVTKYIQDGLLPRAKHYAGVKMRTSIDLMTTHKVLGEAESRALDYFLEHIYVPALKDDPELSAMISKLATIDSKGLFTSILLRQLADLGRRVWPSLPSDDLREEIIRFVDYLVRLASRARGEQLGDQLGFIGRYIRCAVVLLALSGKIHYEGTAPYRNRAQIWFDKGAEVLYFLAWEPHLEAAREVCEQLRNLPFVDVLLENRFVVRKERRDEQYSCIMVTTKIKAAVSDLTPDNVVDIDADDSGANPQNVAPGLQPSGKAVKG